MVGLTTETTASRVFSPPDTLVAESGTAETKKTKDGVELFPQPSKDPRDPLNWPMRRKMAIYCIMMFGTFVGPLTANANVLATPVQAETWGVTPNQAAYSVSATLAGIIVGPVLLVPLVQVFGVMACCFWSQVAIVATSIWSALSDGPNDYNSFIASRAIAGLFCSTVQVFASGVIVQIFFLHQRGKAFAVYSTLYILATTAGPSFSGFIVQYVSWPICYWYTVAANGLGVILFLLFADDTTWDREKDRPLALRPLPESWFKKRVQLFFFGTSTVPKAKIGGITRSLDALWRIAFSPISVLVGVYSFISFGWFIMASVQIPILLQGPDFGFSPQSTACVYFSAWIGAISGVVYGTLVNDRLPLWLQKRNNGAWAPEYRLHTCWVPSLLIGPIGAGLFGSAIYYQTHWIALAFGEGFLVFGASASISGTVNYVVETFRSFPQEVGTALNVWRIIFSIFVTFFYPGWVAAVGANWVWGTAAFINLFGFGLIVVLLWKGPLIRSWSLLPDESRLDDEIRNDKEALEKIKSEEKASSLGIRHEGP